MHYSTLSSKHSALARSGLAHWEGPRQLPATRVWLLHAPWHREQSSMWVTLGHISVTVTLLWYCMSRRVITCFGLQAQLLLTSERGCMSSREQDLTFSWLSLPLASPYNHHRGKDPLKIQGYFQGRNANLAFFTISKPVVYLTWSYEVESTFNFLDPQDKGNKRCNMSVNSEIHKTTHPRNCAPAGPISTSLLANPSPSTIGGGLASLCLFTKRQVMRVGAVHLRGGMIIRIP